MAEYILRAEANGAGRNVRTLSLGTLGIIGRSAASNAIIALDEIGIDLRPHRSQGISLAVLGACKHVFVMEQEHTLFIQRMAPQLAPKIQMLGAWDPEDRRETIDDPVNQDIEAFRFSRDRIRRAIRNYLNTSPIR